MKALRFISWAILIAMIAVTARASLDRSVFDAGRDLWPDWWFRATLADAYFGFLTVYLWVWYREGEPIPRLIWAFLFATLGNIAIAAYLLRALAKLPPNARIEHVLLREG